MSKAIPGISTSLSPNELLAALKSATDTLNETAHQLIEKLVNSELDATNRASLTHSLEDVVKLQKNIARTNWSARAVLDIVEISENGVFKELADLESPRSTGTPKSDAETPRPSPAEISAASPRPEPAASSDAQPAPQSPESSQADKAAADRVGAIAQAFDAQAEASRRQQEEDQKRRAQQRSKGIERSRSLNLSQMKAVVSPFVKEKQESILAPKTPDKTSADSAVSPLSSVPLTEKIASLSASKAKAEEVEKPKKEMPQIDTSASRTFFNKKLEEAQKPLTKSPSTALPKGRSNKKFGAEKVRDHDMESSDQSSASRRSEESSNMQSLSDSPAKPSDHPSKTDSSSALIKKDSSETQLKKEPETKKAPQGPKKEDSGSSEKETPAETPKKEAATETPKKEDTPDPKKQSQPPKRVGTPITPPRHQKDKKAATQPKFDLPATSPSASTSSPAKASHIPTAASSPSLSTGSKRSLTKAQSVMVELPAEDHKPELVSPRSPQTKKKEETMTLANFLKYLAKIGKSINPPLSWYGDFWNGIPPLGKEKSETATISVWLDRLKTTAEILALFATQREKEKSKVLMELHKYTAKDKGIVIEPEPHHPTVAFAAPTKEKEKPKSEEKLKAAEPEDSIAGQRSDSKNSSRKLKSRAASTAVTVADVPKAAEEPAESNASSRRRRRNKRSNTLEVVTIATPIPAGTKATAASATAEGTLESPSDTASTSTSASSTKATSPEPAEPAADAAMKTVSAPVVKDVRPKLSSSPPTLTLPFKQTKDDTPSPVSLASASVPAIPTVGSPKAEKPLPAILSTSTSSRRRVVESLSVTPEQSQLVVSPSGEVVQRSDAAASAAEAPPKSTKGSGEGKSGESSASSRAKPKSSDGSAEDETNRITADLLVSSRPGIVPVAAKRNDPIGRRNSVDELITRSAVSSASTTSSPRSQLARAPSPSPNSRRVAFGAPKEPQKQLVTRRSLTNLKGQIARMKVQQVQSQVRGTSSTDSEVLSDGTESPTSPRLAPEYIEQQIRKSIEMREREIERLSAWLEKEKMIVAGDGSTKLTNWEQMQARKRAREQEDASSASKDFVLDQHAAALASEGKSKFSVKPKREDSSSSILAPTLPKRDELANQKTKKISFRTMTLNTRMTWEAQENPRAKKFEEPESDGNIRFAEINNEQTVCAATVEKLIQRLTYDSMPDPTYQNCFLLTYRSFMTPKELLDLLELRWNTAPPIGTRNIEDWKQTTLLHIRLRISNALKTWIEKFFNDFEDDPELTSQLNAFLDKMETNGLEKPALQVKKSLAMKAEGKEKQQIEHSLPDPPPPHLPKEIKEQYTFLDFHPEEVARQLTLIEIAMFKNIQYKEILGVRWTKKNKEKFSPNVLKMIRFSNHVTGWVANEIVRAEDVRIRAITLNRFLVIASVCLILNNFNAAMEIFSALRSSAVFRLRRTWNLLPDDGWEVYSKLETVFESDANWKNYRQALEYAVPPAVPYLGRYLSELLFIAEKYPDMVPDTDLINFGKMYLVADIITQIQLLQSIPYRFQRLPLIESYILNAQSSDAKRLHTISLAREPKLSARHLGKSDL